MDGVGTNPSEQGLGGHMGCGGQGCVRVPSAMLPTKPFYVGWDTYIKQRDCCCSSNSIHLAACPNLPGT